MAAQTGDTQTGDRPRFYGLSASPVDPGFRRDDAAFFVFGFRRRDDAAFFVFGFRRRDDVAFFVFGFRRRDDVAFFVFRLSPG